MAAELINDCLQPDAMLAARRFFDAQPDNETVKSVFEALLEKGAYDRLADIIFYGSIIRQKNASDYRTGLSARTPDDTFFDLFMTMADKAKVEPDKLYPMLVAARYSSGSLGRWRSAAENYFTLLAERNFNEAAVAIAVYDTQGKLYRVLLRADAEKTLQFVIELLAEHNGRKTALKKFLLESKLDIVPALIAAYEAGNAKRRLAVMRVLLLYKSDERALAVIRQAAENDTSKSVQKLLEHDVNMRKKEQAADTVKALLFNMMVTGSRMEIEDFQELIERDETADSLFFTDDAGEVFIVDKGKTLDTDNQPITVTGTVGVLHPTELPAKLGYLLQLNIKQCFPQLHRACYKPDEVELQYNRSMRLAGTVVPAEKFRKGLRAARFKLLNTENSVTSRAGVVRDGILCEVSFAPTDFKEGVVKIEEITFYPYAATVKLNGNVYTEGVQACDIADIHPRVYSECIFDVFTAAGL